MAKNSSIEWTNHTFNPWWGCVKVSPACTNCYAESWAKRVGKKVWGPQSPRRFFSENHWKEPLKWNSEASADGERRRVFCASMADVFEGRGELDSSRDRLWDLIEKTPMLDWLLLTKRPHNIKRMAPWVGDGWPENVWLGTTVENQTWAEKRLSHLVQHKAKVHFISCEPLLGILNLDKWKDSLDWVIAGGESGPKARPMNPLWPRHLRDFCMEEGIAFHFKQWGHWAPVSQKNSLGSKVLELDGETMAAVGKLKAGRALDGDTWDGVPTQLAA